MTTQIALDLIAINEALDEVRDRLDATGKGIADLRSRVDAYEREVYREVRENGKHCLRHPATAGGGRGDQVQD